MPRQAVRGVHHPRIVGERFVRSPHQEAIQTQTQPQNVPLRTPRGDEGFLRETHSERHL